MSVATDQAEMTVAAAMNQLCVRGYHIYKDVWAAVVGKELVWRKEIPTMFMLSVMKDIVSLLATCSGKNLVASLFLMKNGTNLWASLGKKTSASSTGMHVSQSV